MSQKKQRTFSIRKKITYFALVLVTVFSGLFFINPTPAHAADCSDVFTPLSTSVVNGVNANKTFYQNAMNETGVPWEMLAAIHYRETNFSHSNPSNGQGIFQFVGGAGGPYPTGPVSDDEFYRQLKFMANKLQDDYVWRGSIPRERRKLQANETNLTLVKDTLFSYNGRASVYANQAGQYGYSPTLQPYEGSPYVMNRFDCRRARMGIITQDFGTMDGIDTRYGTFTLFARLRGDGYWLSLLPASTEQLNFIRLNHWSGGVEVLGYSSISEFTYAPRNTVSNYPAVAPDGAVIPIFWPTGDLVFIRLNHSSGKAELVSYSASSAFKQMINYQLTSYPATSPDGAVTPMFRNNGDLCFVRLNHGSGNAEIVCYSAASGFKQLSLITLTSYPAVPADGAVVPLMKPNGDLSFVRLNHSSGKTEIVTYSSSSGYKHLVEYQLTPYPAVATDGTVVPMFKPNGDLSFVRLNHSSGKVEVVSYNGGSGYQLLSDLKLTAYPAVPADGTVIPTFTR